VRKLFIVITFLFLANFLFLCFLRAQSPSPTAATDRIQLTLNTDEAEAVLAILDKRASGAAVTEADWQRIFTTEPYLRLKKREAQMHRDFTDDDFRKFVLSPELSARNSELRHTLNAWKQTDLAASAR
jgi:regulatory protein YycI of two-component signal transduction system YycFG